MKILDADFLTYRERAAVARWLDANGCTHHVSTDFPVIIRGNRAEYVAICKRNPKAVKRINLDADGRFWLLGRRSVHIRVPLSDYLRREVTA